MTPFTSRQCTRCGATLESPILGFDFIRCADCGAIDQPPDLLALRAWAPPVPLEDGEQVTHDPAARRAQSDGRALRQLEAWILSARDAERGGATMSPGVELLERVRALALGGDRRAAMELLLRQTESLKSWLRKAAVCFSLSLGGMAAAFACYYLVHPAFEGHAAAVILGFLFPVPATVMGAIYLLIWRFKRVYKEPS